MRRAALVYQGGIANVFELRSPRDSNPELAPFAGDPRGERKRLFQGAFATAHAYASGLKAAGVEVLTFGCNKPGDAALFDWVTPDEFDDLPFSTQLHRV
jgi:hypothetical protein